VGDVYMNPNLLREARSTPYNIGDTPEDERKKVERNGVAGNGLNMASSVENFAVSDLHSHSFSFT
jgi:hypothetical protein